MTVTSRQPGPAGRDSIAGGKFRQEILTVVRSENNNRGIRRRRIISRRKSTVANDTDAAKDSLLLTTSGEKLEAYGKWLPDLLTTANTCSSLDRTFAKRFAHSVSRSNVLSPGSEGGYRCLPLRARDSKNNHGQPCRAIRSFLVSVLVLVAVLTKHAELDTRNWTLRSTLHLFSKAQSCLSQTGRHRLTE